MKAKVLRPLVLYLDFDGVLHPDAAYWTKSQGIVLHGPGSLFMHAPILEEILAPYAGTLSIILSTSWVRVRRFDRARKALPSPLLQQLVRGATWHSQMDQRYWQHLSRFEQIEWHMRRHGITHWLALDNDSLGWPDAFAEHLVLCDDDAALGDTTTQSALREKLISLYRAHQATGQ